MRDSISNTDSYLDVCRAAVSGDSVFQNFKRFPGYRAILEHVTFEDGQRYLDIIESTAPNLLQFKNKFFENDIQGNPLTFDYSIGTTSPTTLRYIKVVADLQNLFGSLDGMDIVEIGCGYGGQSKVLCEAFNIKSYTYIDLPDVINLIEKYTNPILPNQDREFISSYELKDKIKDSYDLVISNYAFSECIPQVQRDYIDLVLNKSQRGYLTCNFTNHVYGLDYLKKEQLTEEINHTIGWYEETPNSFSGNIVMNWGHDEKDN